MLTDLHVKNIALLKDVEMHFGPGLNVLSGETGAGKSILLDSILLALGARADSDLLRSGEEEALIELIYLIEHESTLRKLATLGIEAEDGTLVLTRRISRIRSISRINGEAVPLSKLKAASELILEVYGQQESRTLSDEENHLLILDAYAGERLYSAKARYEDAYAAYKYAKEEAGLLFSDDESRRNRMEYLEYALKELVLSDLKAGEEERLKARLHVLLQTEKIAQNLKEALETLENAVSDPLSRAVVSIKSLTESDPSFEKEFSLANDLEQILSDLLSSLKKRSESLPENGDELARTEARIDEIAGLKRKYGGTEAAVLAQKEAFSSELERFMLLNERKEELSKALSDAKDELKDAAKKLSVERKNAAASFDRALEATLRDLNFPYVRFRTLVEETNRYTKRGADSVRFFISTNQGEEIKPLKTVASGGELSRVMLAVKTLTLQGDNEEKTLLFDEVDQGISGFTAVKVGEKLKELAFRHQVLLISHLPQIVATADRHYRIEKNVLENETVTTVNALTEEDSIREIARLLAAGELTDAALQNASELRVRMKGGNQD